MNIAIDLTSLSYHLTGIERYAMCITDKIINLDKDNTYILVFRNEISSIFLDRIDGKRVRAVVLKGNHKLFFLQFVLYKELNKINADKYLFFAFPSPILFRKKGIINTIHDMGAWDSPNEMTLLSKYYFRLSYRNVAQVSEKIITVSKFSKARIQSILGVSSERLCLAYCGVYDRIANNSHASLDFVRKEYSLPQKYILTLSTLEPRKNLCLLLKAFNNIADRVDYDLVLVGRKGWKTDEVIKEYSSKSRIHTTGFVKDEHLANIYKGAICFVFPSLYEGFGIPPIEALSLGVPVVSSDAASLPEVLMDKATFFKNNSLLDLQTRLLEIEEKKDCMAKELNDYQIENYNFEKSAKTVLSVL